MQVRRAPLSAALVLLAAGCGGADPAGTGASSSSSETATPSVSPSGSPSGTPTVTPLACARLLSVREAARLVGDDVGPPEETTVGTLPACVWTAADGTTVTAGRFPAADWARALPDLIDLVQDSGLELTEADRRKLERGQALVERGGAADDAAACALFTTMVVRLQGSPAGSTRVVNYLPSKAAPQAVNGQACEAGTYSTVQLVAKGLRDSPAQTRRVARTLRHLID